jgi:hypothetical protein
MQTLEKSWRASSQTCVLYYVDDCKCKNDLRTELARFDSALGSHQATLSVFELITTCFGHWAQINCFERRKTRLLKRTTGSLRFSFGFTPSNLINLRIDNHLLWSLSSNQLFWTQEEDKITQENNWLASIQLWVHTKQPYQSSNW